MLLRVFIFFFFFHVVHDVRYQCRWSRLHPNHCKAQTTTIRISHDTFHCCGGTASFTRKSILIWFRENIKMLSPYGQFRFIKLSNKIFHLIDWKHNDFYVFTNNTHVYSITCTKKLPKSSKHNTHTFGRALLFEYQTANRTLVRI